MRVVVQFEAFVGFTHFSTFFGMRRVSDGNVPYC